MKILVVEDDAERVSTFYKMFADHDLVIANTARVAIDILKQMRFAIIFLDHDLGNRVYVSSSDPNTGMAVAKGVVETINSDSRFIVHSWNPAGAENIRSYLCSAGCGSVEVKLFGTFDASVIYG